MSPALVDESLDLGVLPLWGDDPGHPDGTLTLATAPAPAPVVAPTDHGETPSSEGAILTLESALVTAWQTLANGSPTACLLCGGLVQPRWSAGAGVVGGRCGDCGTAIE